MNSADDLAVVIVNYNTAADLRNCLASIFDSRQALTYKVFVVDNASSDGSADMVAKLFPAAALIRSAENLGFARANNIAIRSSEAPFLLLLNPDTLVVDHAFDRMIDFLKANPDAGMVSCRLVKRDGALDLACRRSFPSAFDGLCRAVGLSAMFPRSRRLARYNLTFLDERQTAEVDAINGAFMMVRRSAMEEVGLLDEDYFMYMEDLDWCYRFRSRGWKVYYHPAITIVHLKGQAGKKNSAPMIHAFFDSMELFCRKNYRQAMSSLAADLTVAGIRCWKYATLLRNALRAEKRVTP